MIREIPYHNVRTETKLEFSVQSTSGAVGCITTSNRTPIASACHVRQLANEHDRLKSMHIKSTIAVGNNSSCGFDSVEINTNCYGFVEIVIPTKPNLFRIELHRGQLREFLARTTPEFVTEERYKAEGPKV